MTKRAAAAAVAVLLLGVTGCGPAQPVAGPSSTLTNTPPNEVSGLAIPAGRIDEAVAKVDGLVADLMKSTGIPGMAVAIVHGGKTLYTKGFGIKDASKGQGQDNKVDADTVFQLASVSKSVGATVVAHEVSDNVVTWDTPVVSKLPWLEALTAEFMDLVQYGQVREDWAVLYQKAIGWMNNPEGSLVGKQPPANPAPARPLRDYAGVYASDYWGPAAVTEHDGALQLAIGPKNRTFPLTHWDGDTLTFPVTDENAPPGTISKAVFSGFPNGTLNLEYYDSDKLGTFTR